MNPIEVRTEEDLERLAQNGLLEETHWLDLKRELSAGNSGNKELAKDIAAFALDGGTILIGVDEETSPPRLWPVPLAGLPERIEQVARMRVDEAVQVRTTIIESADTPAHGYIVVHIPQSVRAPHMADGRYYGRGDKTNRVLPNTEVVRLLDRRLTDRRDLRAEALAIRTELVGDDIPLLVVVAEPLNAPDDMLVSLAESSQWQESVLHLVRSVVGPHQRTYAPALAEATGFARRPDGVALTTGMYDGQRFAGKDRAAEIVFHESGRLVLASERAVTIRSFVGVVFPPPPDVTVVFEALILGHVDLLARLAGAVSHRWGYTGSWRFALSLNGLRDSVSWLITDRTYGDRGPVYTKDVYERATEASLSDLDENPGRVTAALTAPLLRSLGSHEAFAKHFERET
ncbi:ATP-binding protein [Mycolicibacterium cosmeticum]|uniref:Divergent AAA domain protein n=1 Tax=Mycolicibacterium cosmeticum TaxID=258533 RepID=W9AN37_MYCCO|nr:ATP-binding protein [Mycolicibacterium cosmeticum]TLH68036.1 ATP-binding protein [Mycolicibacterium cosmeticum]CDO06898.1 Divergent AAA domain protein [Mycolicibacterium cosmeticum]